MKESSKVDSRLRDADGDVAPLIAAPTYDLDALLAMITPENLPIASDWIEAAPVGGEAC